MGIGTRVNKMNVLRVCLTQVLVFNICIAKERGTGGRTCMLMSQSLLACMYMSVRVYVRAGACVRACVCPCVCVSLSLCFFCGTLCLTIPLVTSTSSVYAACVCVCVYACEYLRVHDCMPAVPVRFFVA